MPTFTLNPLSLEAPFRLPDGRALRFAPVTPAARPLIERAMTRLSPQTSRRRFFTVRYRLSDRELDELTHLDGVDRFAVGASVRGPGGDVEGVGVARYVRDARERDSAELALLVVDAFQGMGVGRALLARLTGAAIARGVARLTGLVLTDNEPMLRLLRECAPALALVRMDEYYRVELPLPQRTSWLAARLRALARYAGGPFNSMTLPSGSAM